MNYKSSITGLASVLSKKVHMMFIDDESYRVFSVDLTEVFSVVLTGLILSI